MGGADSTPYCFFWGPRYYTGSSSLSAYTIERLCPKPWWIFKSLISHHSGSQRSVVWPENLLGMQSNYFVKQLVSRVAGRWLVIPSCGTMSSPTQANMPVYWVMAFSVFRVFYVTWCLSSFSLISSTAPKVGGRWVSTPLPKISQCFCSQLPFRQTLIQSAPTRASWAFFSLPFGRQQMAEVGSSCS